LAFLILCTSPQNYQARLALADAPADFPSHPAPGWMQSGRRQASPAWYWPAALTRLPVAREIGEPPI
jgi:hypothetical protein